MQTISTPKTIADLRYQEHVIQPAIDIDEEARWFFREYLSSEAHVYTRLLFTENGREVYAAYQDPRSVDYLYLVK